MVSLASTEVPVTSYSPGVFSMMSRPARPMVVSLLPAFVALALFWGPPVAAAQPGSMPDSGQRLLFVAYGDTRPNLYPFGKQEKHQALTRAILRYDAFHKGEVDAVLVSGDYIFADVPLTDRDWNAAHAALANFRSGPRPLLLYPTLGNHELVTLSDHVDDDKTRQMVDALWRWGGSPVAVAANGPLLPVVLAQETHLAELHPWLSRHFPSDITANDCRVLWNQLASDAVGRLPDADREGLEKARRSARILVRLAAVRGDTPAALAAELASRPSRTLLESLHAALQLVAQGASEAASTRLGRAALARLGDPSTPEFQLLHRNLGPVFDHLKGLRALAQQAGSKHEKTWLTELQGAPDRAFVKNWAVFKKHLLDPYKSSVLETTSLARVPGLGAGGVGPSWYYTDRPLPGAGDRSVRFIVLNSNLATISNAPGLPPVLAQEDFLADAIRSASGPVVVMAHHSPVSVGPHGGLLDPENDLISAWREMVYRRVFPRLTVQEQHRVWAFIAGHDHDLQRLIDRARGTVLLVSGGGGVPLKEKGVPADRVPAYLEQAGRLMDTTLDPHPMRDLAYHFVACEVTPGKMEFRTFGLREPAGKTMDDPDFVRELPAVIEAQLADDSKLLDHFVIRELPDGTRVIEELASR
ncbi:MAG: hypothetical protein HY814_06040 [Candidatus Riflebacteria bacterium]|nr:hypothetical protein [Candidatus Riflebacteria bacterium]